MQPREQLVKFFKALDRLLQQQFTMTIIGGSAMVLGYESERMTSDCDPWGKAQEELLANWSEAQKVSGINLRIDEQTGVAQFPENFEDRLVEADLSLKKLTIKYPEKHDLALSKVVRLLGNDLDDIIWLHKNHKLDFKTFKARYYEEVRPIYIGDVSNLDFNFLDAVEELFGLEERQKCEKDSERI